MLSLKPFAMSGMWVCEACTFFNTKPHALCCEVCHTNRVNLPPSAPTALDFIMTDKKPLLSGQSGGSGGGAFKNADSLGLIRGVSHVRGDLLTAPEQFIVHQTNCVSTKNPKGLAVSSSKACFICFVISI
jgi:hypothetical protein